MIPSSHITSTYTDKHTTVFKTGQYEHKQNHVPGHPAKSHWVLLKLTHGPAARLRILGATFVLTRTGTSPTSTCESEEDEDDEDPIEEEEEDPTEEDTTEKDEDCLSSVSLTRTTPDEDVPDEDDEEDEEEEDEDVLTTSSPYFPNKVVEIPWAAQKSRSVDIWAGLTSLGKPPSSNPATTSAVLSSSPSPSPYKYLNKGCK